MGNETQTRILITEVSPSGGRRNENHPLCHDEVFKMNGDVKCRCPPGRAGPESKDDFGYSTTRKFVVEDVVNSGQKMAEEALFLVK